MTSSPLITTVALAELLARDAVSLFDCRHSLQDPSWGRTAYAEGHIPGAFFAGLDDHLSDLNAKDAGRHPLPDLEKFQQWLGSCGVTPGRPVVAYDEAAGSTASRLWWLMGFLGHQQVAVLDGGLKQWLADGQTLSAVPPQVPAEKYTGQPDWSQVVSLEEIVAGPASPNRLLVDARGASRFEGKEEPLDPVAGHIPGARNHPFTGNVGPEGRFLPPEALRAALSQRYGGTAPEQVVHYCGSGVSACHNLLAQAVAGLPPARLYPGSWSQWCADPSRPVETGPGGK